nr:restriction endonuclease subunit S [uncultured Dyadobacter sp.]
MITDLKPYSEYKKTDINWLCDIPAHWTIRRMKYILRETDSRSPEGKEQLLRVSQYTGVTQRLGLNGGTEPDTRAKSLKGYKHAQPDFMVINIMLAWNGSLGVSRFSGIVSPAYCVYRFNSDAYPWYFHHLLRSPIYKQRIKAFSTGVVESRLRLYSDNLYRIEAILPPPDEQAAIVKFLDYATHKIDLAIRAKRKLVNLLNEQKQTIIHHVVTRGLDADVPMRDSGVDWIGEIPAHWNCYKMKYVTSMIGGMTPSKSNGKFWDGQIPWVSPKDMKVEVIADSKNHISALALAETSISLIPPPAVLIVVRGMILARTFPTAITKVPVTINQDMKAIMTKSIVNPDYLTALLTGSKRELLNLVEEAGHGTKCLRTDSWDGFKIPLPPLEEQERILSYINSETTKLKSTIDRIEREIKLLQEYRTRLIADIVTGQLDVREVVQNLSEDEEKSSDALSELEEEESELEEEMLSEE